MALEIVYIEDNPAEVYVLFEAVRKLDSNLRLTVVPDGQAALNFLSEAQGAPCVVVMDLGLPQIDGVVVFKALKDNPAFEDVPVVVFAEYEGRRRVLSTGFKPDLFLTKPMDLKGYAPVAEKIVELCKRAQTPAAATA